MKPRVILALLAVALGGSLVVGPRVEAYVEARYTLPKIILESTNIVVMQVEKVNKERKLIYFKKVADLKGQHPAEAIKHNVGVGGFNAREKEIPIEWAEPGKLAIFFHNGSASETCLGKYWYQTYPGGEWWNHSHGEPFLARTYSGDIEGLREAVEKLLKNEDVVIPCTVSKNDLRIQKVRAVMKDPEALLVVEPPKIEKFKLENVAGFSDMIDLPRPAGKSNGAIVADFDRDAFPDLLVLGSQGMRLLRNNQQGNFEDVTDRWGLTSAGGASFAGFADYNRSGRLSLLTSAGQLFTNLGDKFRDDTALLPSTPKRVPNPGQACAWLDIDADGLPDIVASVGTRGLAAFRNLGGKDNQWFGDISGTAGLGEQGLGTEITNYLTALDVNGDFRTDFILNAQASLIALNSGAGAFAVNKETGLSFPGVSMPAVACADFLNTGRPGLFVTTNERRGFLADWQMTGTFSAEEDEALAADGNFSPQTRPAIKVGESSWRWRALRAKPSGVLEIGRGSPSPNAAYAVSTFTWPQAEKVALHVGSENGVTAWLNGTKVYEFKEKRRFSGDSDTVEVEVKQGPNTVLLKVFDEGPTWRTSVRVAAPGIYPSAAVQLYQGDGQGKFTDLIHDAGDLAQLRAECVAAVWGDLNNDGHLDLIVTAKTGLVRVYLNQGGGRFHYAAAEMGLEEKFKAVGVATGDFNRDGQLDLVLMHTDPDPCMVLFSQLKGQLAPLTVSFSGPQSAIGATVTATDAAGKLLGARWISGGDGRDQQASPEARFALAPGKYRVQVRYSSGATQDHDVVVAQQPVWSVIDSAQLTAAAK